MVTGTVYISYICLSAIRMSATVPVYCWVTSPE